MTDRITIPPEAVKAAATAIFDASPFREQAGGLHEQSEQYQTLTRVYARAAIRALKSDGAEPTQSAESGSMPQQPPS